MANWLDFGEPGAAADAGRDSAADSGADSEQPKKGRV